MWREIGSEERGEEGGKGWGVGIETQVLDRARKSIKLNAFKLEEVICI